MNWNETIPSYECVINPVVILLTYLFCVKIFLHTYLWMRPTIFIHLTKIHGHAASYWLFRKFVLLLLAQATSSIRGYIFPM